MDILKQITLILNFKPLKGCICKSPLAKHQEKHLRNMILTLFNKHKMQANKHITVSSFNFFSSRTKTSSRFNFGWKFNVQTQQFGLIAKPETSSPGFQFNKCRMKLSLLALHQQKSSVYKCHQLILNSICSNLFHLSLLLDNWEFSHLQPCTAAIF